MPAAALFNASPSTFGVWGCIVAVLLWSFKPALISLTPQNVGFAEVYLLSGGLAVAIGTPLLVKLWMSTPEALSRRSLVYIAAAGVCLGAWYYGFYRALKEAPVLEASVIGFSWVLIATIVMPYLGPKDIRKMTIAQWGLMLVAFLGVALVTSSGLEGNGGKPQELIWAGIAAVGSGLYLPFGVKATRALEECLPPLKATTVVITGANIASLISVGSVLWITQADLSFSSVTPWTLAICGVIGIGVYILAEILWTWGYSQTNSQAVGIMPYAVPAVSSLILVLFFDQALTLPLLIGIGLIVVANVLMQFTGVRNVAPAP